MYQLGMDEQWYSFRFLFWTQKYGFLRVTLCDDSVNGRRYIVHKIFNYHSDTTVSLLPPDYLSLINLTSVSSCGEMGDKRRLKPIYVYLKNHH